MAVYPTRVENKLKKVRPERLRDSARVTELGSNLRSDSTESLFLPLSTRLSQWNGGGADPSNKQVSKKWSFPQLYTY